MSWCTYSRNEMYILRLDHSNRTSVQHALPSNLDCSVTHGEPTFDNDDTLNGLPCRRLPPLLWTKIWTNVWSNSEGACISRDAYTMRRYSAASGSAVVAMTMDAAQMRLNGRHIEWCQSGRRNNEPGIINVRAFTRGTGVNKRPC